MTPHMDVKNIELTLSILKPDITKRNLTGAVNSRIETAGFEIIAQKRHHLTYEQAALFYAEHKERTFFEDLCRYITQAPIVAQVLRGENAILKYRELMGPTNPSSADRKTLRGEFGRSIEENSVHGSDSSEAAHREVPFFFSTVELLPVKKAS